MAFRMRLLNPDSTVARRTGRLSLKGDVAVADVLQLGVQAHATVAQFAEIYGRRRCWRGMGCKRSGWRGTQRPADEGVDAVFRAELPVWRRPGRMSRPCYRRGGLDNWDC